MNDQLTVGSAFSGIGGFDLGFERAGMRTIWQCEIDPWCQRVLEKHWPGVKRYGDIRTVTADTAIAPDVFCAGFPCQPVSFAGKGLAQDDERWLWPECARIIGELRPRYAVMENVPGLFGRGMGDVLGDLSEMGYDAEWGAIWAADAGAPHKRERVWIVAYPNSESDGLPNGQIIDMQSGIGADGRMGRHTSGLRHQVSNASGSRLEGRSQSETAWATQRVFASADRFDGRSWATEPSVGRVVDGVPDWSHRIRALGNALVPQIAQWIGEQIVSYENARAAA